MAHDSPDLPELVRTALEFVIEITPKLEGQDRYHALCVNYLLEIVLRELNEWHPIDTPDDRRLRSLLDVDGAIKAESVVVELSQAIRGGQFDDRMGTLLEALLAHVESKVAVSKPSYLEDEVDL